MRKLIIPVVVIFIALLLMSIFVVKEGDRGIVVRFGRIIKDNNTEVARIYEPGIHFKVPVFDRVRTLDARIQTMDDQADRFVTAEKKDVIIDTYVKWRIKDFGAYYLTTGGGDKSTAEALLKRKVVDSLRAEIGAKEIKQIVSGPDRGQTIDPGAVVVDDTAPATEIVAQVVPRKEVEGQRDQIMADVLVEAQESAKDLGIEVVDFRMKKINLPDEISESIYRRMRAERESVARKHRSQGREKAEVIRAQSELEVAKILAAADREARVVRGGADATSAKIYADAFKGHAEFYNFVRSLKAYENSFNSKSDMLVVDPNSDFFRYMKKSDGIN
ncbi:protease modulator HflC [Photobacterium sanguinicancri]|uniref:Protein HflC n=1 Tax=Photobacterium sanguinicancri TaxID=875932 RepID=A0AAW7Y8B5_9GAMM|nr:protease modulator HflC [Photobacterium sanguinicancri]KXI21593.1 protease modulator HflC [Photobacterium sanguinicancri]MDO6544597.1 protease modulator HflC [Photobacterium sanguinicancri]OZS42872.1 protease modulator HflC [Photobacterium sanguinicancri]